MARITRLPFLRHLRGESASWLLLARDGRVTRSGRGLSFWFWPLSASVAELPMDDRELSVLLHARSLDFQDLSAQVVVIWRVREAERLAQRVDFTLDTDTGAWRDRPLEKIAQLLTEQARQLTWEVLAAAPMRELLALGVERLRLRLGEGLPACEAVTSMGLEIVSVTVSALSPSPELERALQTPAREQVQQDADRATFERRALAVERERAIAENELANRIALARREEQLIAQQALNQRRRVSEEAETAGLQARAEAERRALAARALADEVAVVEEARARAEQARVDIYAPLAPAALLALSARELAGNLPAIEHLTLSPELFGPALQRLAEAATVHAGRPA